MWYDRKRNFEGLSKLAEELDSHPNLAALASYCRFREKGLRREAFSALEDFLAASHLFNGAAARSAAVTLLEANARASGTHQFLTQPLISRFLLPTLRSWMDDEPTTGTPVRWLGMLLRDDELLDRALSICPEDTPVRSMLIERYLYFAEYATHHLDETIFLGSVDGAVTDLAHARELITNAPEPDALAHLASKLHYFDSLIADWMTYSENPTGSFPEWCAERGKNYGYPTKIYYKR
jgi:hypothetical protein